MRPSVMIGLASIDQRNIQAAQLVSFVDQFEERNLMAESKPKDAIALLKQDHRTVEDLFAQSEKARGEGRKESLARQICLELSIHTALEEEIFYPACEGSVDEDLLKESYVEHDAAKLLIAEIEGANGESDEYFDSKV